MNESIRNLMQRLISENIRDLGIHVQPVFSTIGGPSFGYTVGLFKKLGYELLVVGLNPADIGPLLYHVYCEIEQGESLEEDKPDDRWANMPVVWKRCINPIIHEEYTVQADIYWKTQVPVLQMIIPDRDGKFPWDRGYDSGRMNQVQPLLYMTH